MLSDPTFIRRNPPPLLRGLVNGVYAYSEGGVAMRAISEPAGLDVPFIVNFGSPFEIALGRTPGKSDRFASFSAGLYAGPVVMNSDGGAQCIQVNFTPLGGRIFYGLPLSELANRMTPLAELADPLIDQIVMRLGDLNSWEARLDLVEQFVAARLASAVRPAADISWALGQIEARSGMLPIAELCRDLGWSRRRLAEAMRHEFGLTPKTIARIARFQAAEAMALQTRRPDWADISAACGFSDQAHMAREFTDLAGRSPTAFLAAA